MPEGQVSRTRGTPVPRHRGTDNPPLRGGCPPSEVGECETSQGFSGLGLGQHGDSCPSPDPGSGLGQRVTARDVEGAKEALLVDIGTSLETVREQRGLTVSQMAHLAGISKRALIYNRKAQGDPKLSTLIAQHLAVGRKLVVDSVPIHSEDRDGQA